MRASAPMLDAEGLVQAVLEGNREMVRALVSAALGDGARPVDILAQGLLPGMDVVGRRFGAREVSIGEVLLSARAMHTGLARLKPLFPRPDAASGATPTVVIGTVQGDVHDIGKNLVAMMLEAGGFTVVDLGTNVSCERFAEAVQVHRPAVLAMSALLTTTMREMRHTLETLRRTNLVSGVKTIVGGAPVTVAFAKSIGADGWAPDAPAAVTAVAALVRGGRVSADERVRKGGPPWTTT